MKVTYLSPNRYRPGTILPIQDVPEGVLYHLVYSDGKVDERYFNFSEDGYIWDHKDSPPMIKGGHTTHRILESITDKAGRGIII